MPSSSTRGGTYGRRSGPSAAAGVSDEGDGTAVDPTPAPSPDERQQRPRYAVPAGVVYEVLGDEAVVLDIERGTYFKLNETAAIAYGGLDEAGVPGEAVARIVGRYDVEEEAAERDVSELVRSLLAAGLLRPVR